MAYAQSPRLVGRTRELEVLLAAYGRACAGQPSVVVVEGESGIGKTRLVREFAQKVAADCDRDHQTVIATGYGVDLAGGAVPYGAAASLLQDLVLEVGREAVVGLLGASADSLVPLVPELGAASAAGAELDRLELFGVIQLLLTGLTRDRLVVLFLEDIHWSDASSLDLLVFLASASTRGQLLLVLTTRPVAHAVEGPVPVAHQVEAISRLDHAVLVTLPPLTADEVAEQVHDALGSAGRPPSPTNREGQELVARIQQLSEGIPLYVEELVAVARGGNGTPGAVPSGLRLNLAGRLNRLDSPTMDMLGAAALEERPVTASQLARVVDVPPHDAGTTLDIAVAHGLMDPLPQGRYRFHHVLLRHAVAESMPASTRSRWHQRWAEVLEADAANQQAETVFAIAEHWWQAAPPGSRAALEASIRAAELAERYGSSKEARPHWLRVLELSDAVPDFDTEAERDEALTRLTSRLAYTHAEVLEVVVAEESRASPLTGVRRVWIWAHRLSSERSLGRKVRRVTDGELREALAVLADSTPSAMVFDAEETLMHFVHWSRYLRAFSDDVLAEMDRTATALGQLRPLAVVVDWRAIIAAEAGRIDDYLAAILGVVARTEGVDRKYHVYFQVAAVAGFAAKGEIDETISRGEATLAQMADPNLEHKWGPLATILAGALMFRGDWDRAAELFADVGVHARSASWGHEHRGSATLALRRGDPAAAGDLLASAREVPRRDPPDPMEFSAQFIAAELSAYDHDVPRARETLRPVLEDGTLGESSECTWIPVLAGARYSWQEPVADAAWMALVRDAAARVYHWGPLGVAWPAEVQAHLARAEGREAADLWRSAAEAWAAMGATYEEAECRVRLAEALVREGDKPAAVDELAAALAVADRLHAVPLADEIRSLAARALLRLPGQEPAEGTHGLTAREHAVLRLVADGRTNDQIGAALFMAPKTASVHVSRIMAKLGAANRTEAVALGRRLGLIDS